MVLPGMVTIGPFPEQRSAVVAEVPLPPVPLVEVPPVEAPPVEVPEPPLGLLLPAAPPLPAAPAESPESSVPHPVVNNTTAAVERIQFNRRFMMRRPFK